MKFHPKIAYTYCKYTQILSLSLIDHQSKYSKATVVHLIINEVWNFILKWYVNLGDEHLLFLWFRKVYCGYIVGVFLAMF